VAPERTWRLKGTANGGGVVVTGTPLARGEYVEVVEVAALDGAGGRTLTEAEEQAMRRREAGIIPFSDDQWADLESAQAKRGATEMTDEQRPVLDEIALIAASAQGMGCDERDRVEALDRIIRLASGAATQKGYSND